MRLQAAGLNSLVEWDVQREIDLRVSELQDALTEAIAADPPLAVSEVLNIAKSKKQESNLPDGEVGRGGHGWGGHQGARGQVA